MSLVSNREGQIKHLDSYQVGIKTKIFYYLVSGDSKVYLFANTVTKTVPKDEYLSYTTEIMQSDFHEVLKSRELTLPSRITFRTPLNLHIKFKYKK